MPSKIIQNLGERDYIVACGFCDGRGLEPQRTQNWKITQYSSYSACGVCAGKGVIRVQVTDIPVIDALCQGTGLARADDTPSISKCSACRGIGYRSLSGELKVIR